MSVIIVDWCNPVLGLSPEIQKNPRSKEWPAIVDKVSSMLLSTETIQCSKKIKILVLDKTFVPINNGRLKTRGSCFWVR